MQTSCYRSVTYLRRENGGNGLLIPDGIDARLRIAPVVPGSLNDVKISDEIAFISTDDDVVRSGNGLQNFIDTTI
jgi:hypothetical protein